MRLLWLTPEVPDPGGAGGSIRAFHLIRRLAARGAAITVVAPAHQAQAQRAATLEAGGVELRLVPRPASRVREALRALARRPGLAPRLAADPWLVWQAEAFWTAIEPAVRAALRDGRPDAVVVEHDFAAAWAGRASPDLPAGLLLHNAWWEVLAGRARAARGLQSLGWRAEAWRFRRHVRRTAGRYAWACAVSGKDREAAVRMLGLPVAVVPNGADVGRLAAVPAGPGRPDRLLFSGTLSYPPNAEAAIWLVEAVLPLLRRTRPKVTLTVAGRGAPPAVDALAAVSGVRVAGWVPDLAEAYAEAAVVVAPLRSGGGTKLKVVEAMAAGRPLVTTSVGAEGLDVVSGQHLLVADDAAEFAEAVAGLLADPGRAGRIGAAGRRLAAERYDWAALGDRLHDELTVWLGDGCTSA